MHTRVNEMPKKRLSLLKESEKKVAAAGAGLGSKKKRQSKKA